MPSYGFKCCPLPYVDSVKYLGFMFTPGSKDDVDMQRQLRTFYARSNSILSQFPKCDESVKLVLFSIAFGVVFIVRILADMAKYSTSTLRVAYNNAHRRF